MASVGLLALVLITSTALTAQSLKSVHGRVTDANSGEPVVARVRIIDLDREVFSDPKGQFVFAAVSNADHQLEISAPGYDKLSVRFRPSGELSGSDPADQIAVALSPSSRQHKDFVSVRAYLPPGDSTSGDQFALTNSDMKNLSTVIADDPFRALQALPGVASNDDFQAKFSLRGADFSRVGIYVDGIQLHNAVHSLEGTDLSGSASSFNPELVDQMNLHSGAFSERFADSSAGAVDVHMRDADADRYSFKIIANLGSAGISASGPLGRWKRCSWTGGFRKSYLQYIMASMLTDPSMAFGIEDGEGRIACRVSQANRVSLDLIDSYTDLDRSSLRDQLGANQLMLSNQHALTANLGWLYSPHNNFVIDSHVALLADNFDDSNPVKSPLGEGHYRELAANSTATWMWNAHDALSAGVSTRSITDSGFQKTFDTFQSVELTEQYQGQGSLFGGFLEESWTPGKGGIHLMASTRWDHHTIDGVTAFSPQGSAAFDLLSTLRLQLGWGQYTQFPEVSQFGSNLGSHLLLPSRTNQATVSLEQRVGQSMRVRVEFYDRQDRDLLYQPYLDPRMLYGSLVVPPRNPFYTNSLRGYGRGVEVYVQRSSRKGLTGWVSYAYGRTGMHDGVTGDSFPSNWDQRHTINAYASYRIRPSVNLSSRWTYGSGFPAPGYFSVSGPVQDQNFSLSDQRNRVRIGPYQRWDLRMNKVWQKEKWRKTLYAEVMNVADKANYRFGSLDGYRTSGFAYVTVDQMFPILPSVGFVLER